MIMMYMNKIVAVVGMPGSGKSEVVKILEGAGFSKVYFGGVVIDELKEAGLKVNEENERKMREKLRKDNGMEAMAKLSLPKIEEKIKSFNVVIDGLYSMEEYMLLKKEFPEMVVLAVYSSPKTRRERLSKRPERPLRTEEATERDLSQISNLHTGGPIAMADFTIVNEGGLAELERRAKAFIRTITTK